MQFINDQVELEMLPRAEDLILKPIEKDYLKVLRIEWMITSAILIVIAAAFIFFISRLQSIKWLIVIGGSLIFIIGFYYYSQTRSFRKRGYALREKDIVCRSGWLIESIHICPFKRIQHSSVSTGPLERKWGLATLVLYTAGANDADLRIPGLKEATAKSIKEWITEKIIHEQPV